MSQKPEFGLQVVIASGPTNVQRAVFGLASALAAAHHGTPVVVALTMHGAHWAAESEGRAQDVPGFPPIAELLEMIREAGGRLEACTTCVDNYCPAPVGADGLKVLGHGIVRAGLGTIAGRMDAVPTVLC